LDDCQGIDELKETTFPSRRRRVVEIESNVGAVIVARHNT
jgi:hypothetical protein